MSIIEVVEKFVKMWYNTFACERQIGSFKGGIPWDYLVKAKKNEKKNT